MIWYLPSLERFFFSRRHHRQLLLLFILIFSGCGKFSWIAIHYAALLRCS